MLRSVFFTLTVHSKILHFDLKLLKISYLLHVSDGNSLLSRRRAAISLVLTFILDNFLNISYYIIIHCMIFVLSKTFTFK